MPVYHPNTRFSDCWGSAGDVTFYHRDGVCYWRSRDRHSFCGTSAQLKTLDIHRRALDCWKMIPDDIKEKWNGFASMVEPHKPPFDGSSHITGHNLFVCLNANRSLVGVPLALDAPEQIHGSDAIAFDDIWITPDRIMISGLKDADNPNARLVVKMSPGQGPGVSKAWDKTVIVGDFETSDWGDLDLLEVYTKSFGIDVIPGHKYFLELYWIDEFSGYVSSKTYICFPATEGKSAHGQTFSPRARLQSNDVTGGLFQNHFITFDTYLVTN